MNAADRIKYAEQRIEELKLLIHHWEKANEPRSTSPPEQEHSE